MTGVAAIGTYHARRDLFSTTMPLNVRLHPRSMVTGRAPATGVALVAAGAALWGTDGALRAPLVTTWSPWTIVLFEHIILTLVVSGYLIRHWRETRNLDAAGWTSAVAIAWGGSALATLAFTVAFEYGNPDVVVLLQKTQPLWALVAAALVVGEKPRVEILYVIAPAAVGTYLLSFGLVSPQQAFTGGQGKAALLALTAAALWGSATAFGRRALQQVSSPLLTSLRFTLALPLLLVIAAFEHAVLPPSGSTGRDWFRLVLLALAPGLIAMLLYYRGLVTTPAPVATFAELAFPETALVVNYVFLDATISAAQFAGLVVLYGTIALLHRMPVRVPADVPVPAPA